MKKTLRVAPILGLALIAALLGLALPHRAQASTAPYVYPKPQEGTVSLTLGTYVQLPNYFCGGDYDTTIIVKMNTNQYWGSEHEMGRQEVYQDICAWVADGWRLYIDPTFAKGITEHVVISYIREDTGDVIDTIDWQMTLNSPVPIGDMSEETISNHVQSADLDGDGSPDYGWNSGYDIWFENQTLHIGIDIQLVGDDPGQTLMDTWEQGIEDIWSDAFDIADADLRYNIELDVNWVETDPHHVVTVHSGAGRNVMLEWYTQSLWGQQYQDEQVAHEAGHMLGLYDEYLPDGALDPVTKFVTTDSIMADLGPPREWHYTDIVKWLETGGERDLSLAPSPLPPYPSDGPVSGFSDPFGAPVADAGGPYTAQEGYPLDLDASDSYDPDGSILSYQWLFGDGSTSSGATPSHTYDNRGSYTATLTVIDDDGLASVATTAVTVVDTIPPSLTMASPIPGAALQDGVTFIVTATDMGSGVDSVTFSVREDDAGSGIPTGFENMLGAQGPAVGNWKLSFDTLQLPDGKYVVVVEAIDHAGNARSINVSYSISNWAVIQLLPSSTSNKAGRTMPVKFSLRIAEAIDPNQAFVYNEELEIRIYDTSDPGAVLHTAVMGSGSRNYRIDVENEKYITNFKTARQPAEYSVEIWRSNNDDFLVGSFTFETVK